jgi:hypothetical protein
MLIFDNDKVTGLVIEYQDSGNAEVLSEIFLLSKSLVEAIVSSYDSYYRDELIQESYCRLQYAMKYYVHGYSLHNFFTTVIRNACATYLSKDTRVNILNDELNDDIAYTHASDAVIYDVLSELIARNRQRFPSLSVSVIDDVTETIYWSICEGIKSRTSSNKLHEKYGIDRTKLSIIYHSSLMWMRYKFCAYVTSQNEEADEFSLDTDVREIFGISKYNYMKIILAGIQIRL